MSCSSQYLLDFSLSKYLFALKELLVFYLIQSVLGTFGLENTKSSLPQKQNFRLSFQKGKYSFFLQRSSHCPLLFALDLKKKKATFMVLRGLARNLLSVIKIWHKAEAFGDWRCVWLPGLEAAHWEGLALLFVLESSNPDRSRSVCTWNRTTVGW